MSETVVRPEAPVSALSLLGIFLRIGFTAFGGSTSAWMHRDIVERRKLLSDKDFLTGLTVAQILPGANPVNMAMYLGLQLRGGLGATLAVFGMVLPAFCVILLLGLLYSRLGSMPVTHAVLGGVAAAGVGATLVVGVKLTRRLERSIAPIAIALLTFVTIGLLHWSMVPVVLVAVPVSILLALRAERKRNHV
jgi:chromate transporter